MVKSPVKETRDADSIPGSGRSPGGGHGNSLLYSCLENPHGQGSLVASVHSPRVSCDWSDLTQMLTMVLGT